MKKSKKVLLLEAIKQEDWKTALTIAKSFKKEFDRHQQKTIQHGYSFVIGQSASFFEQLDIDLEKEYATAIEILKDYFEKCRKIEPFTVNLEEFGKKIKARVYKEWGYDENGNKIDE
jgi:hypothetical protein